MKLLKKVVLQAAITMIIFPGLKTHAKLTPILNSLTPHLQKIMRLYSEYHSFDFFDGDTVDDYAEYVLNKYCITIDGNLYEGNEGQMQLTNEDIESLYNLPYVKELTLDWFDLKNVDIPKLFNINKNKTIKCLNIYRCSFSLSDEEILSIIEEKGYKVIDGTSFDIVWPGINPDDLFDNERK